MREKTIPVSASLLPALVLMDAGEPTVSRAGFQDSDGAASCCRTEKCWVLSGGWR